MAYRRKRAGTRRAAPKRRVRRPKANYKARMPSTRGLTLPFPERFNCTMKFNNINNMTQSTAGTPNVYQYRLNHLYDPNYTAISGRNNQQPMYYDQLTGLYATYIVYAVKVTVRATCSVDSYVWMRAAALTTTVPTSTILELERPGTVWKFYSATAGRPAVLSKTISIGALFGTDKKTVLTDNAYIGYNSSTTPVNLGILNIGFEAASAIGTGTSNMSVSFKFYCQWTSRFEPSES